MKKIVLIKLQMNIGIISLNIQHLIFWTPIFIMPQGFIDYNIFIIITFVIIFRYADFLRFFEIFKLCENLINLNSDALRMARPTSITILPSSTSSDVIVVPNPQFT